MNTTWRFLLALVIAVAISACKTTEPEPEPVTEPEPAPVVEQAEIATAMTRASKKRHVVFIFFSRLFQNKPLKRFLCQVYLITGDHAGSLTSPSVKIKR